ncbi:glycosyltransferase family 2 protein [Clostridium sulfidigenes]|uniref:glycosyltransferase family 2 protein n=1 Tax=Clostridium sulfidigenes TaxID=318464 RepID=UPI00069055F4|nr:glycosyltransferase family 2 protein [Clostridium sulfidigenes]
MNSSVISYEKKLKENIGILIENNKLVEAKEIINQYENIVSNDIEIYSIKGVIAMMEGNVYEAERILKEGLALDAINFDVLYNMGYLYETNKNSELAIRYYKRALKNGTDEKIKDSVYEILKALGVKESKEEILKEYDKLDEIKIYKKKLQAQNSIYPKVTIIIPTYNQKEHLREAIDSCLKQDYQNLEILVGDDCSTDGTDKMMRKYVENDKRIRYVRNKKNLGGEENTKKLFYNHTTSMYGMIFNHDDYFIKNDYISKAVHRLIKNPNLSLVWANSKIKNESTGKIGYTNFKNKETIKGIDYFINYETQMYPHITGMLTSVFNFQKLKKIGSWGLKGQEYSIFLDTILYLKLMLVGDIGFIDEEVSVYRLHKDSISYNFPRTYDDIVIKEFELMKEYVLKENLLDKNQMYIWVESRVYGYVRWRFLTLWNTGKKKDALELIIDIKSNYPNSYEKILNNI